MLNVLEITHGYYASGVYRKLFDEFDKNNNLKYEVVVPLEFNKIDDLIFDNNVVSIPIKKLKRFGAVKFAADTLEKIEKKIDLSYTDIVHAHFVKDGLVAYKIKKKYHIPYIVSMRSSCYRSLISKIPYRRLIVKEVLKNASYIIFISNSIRNKVLNHLSGNLKAHVLKNSIVIPNGLDEFWHNNNYIEIREHHKPIKILTVGEISNNKNQISVARAIHNLNSRGYEFEYDIVGSISEKSILDKLKTYPFVKYLGNMKKEDLINIYRNNDIFVMTSFSETFGLVYGEALSQGLPVIYTKNEGFDGWVNDENVGKAVVANSIKDIEKAIVNYSKTATNVIVNKRVELSKRFEWGNSSLMYFDVYKRISNINK